MSKEYKDLLVGLDIGTSKVVAVVAELRPDGAYEVIGMGQTESKGLKKGVVVNIEATVQSIQKALEEAELMADARSARCSRASPAATSAASIRAAWWRSRTRKSPPPMWPA